MLDLSSISDEIKECNLDHFIGSDVISPDLIRVNLDESYRWRTRVAFMLIDIYEQYYAWKRCLELLKAKLWKDHELKGSHRRDGLTVEHLCDVEQYVHDMDGCVECAKHVDNMLKAAAESLSRQLTCLQLKEHIGLSLKDEERHPQKGASTPLRGGAWVRSFSRGSRGQSASMTRKN